ncbi:MAG: [Fe-Fe] hydrogenase large subunit C-terminal domain-containing protein [Moorellales bacterium]
MSEYFHSVRLDREKCKGCTNCIKRCPVEAIRVREGKAHIIEERCIDCGECVRVCPNHAKYVVTDDLERLQEFRYRLALPAPSFYAQFRPDVSPGAVLGALLKMGFDGVFEVALAAEAVSLATRLYLAQGMPRAARPLISSACPAVIRLMQVRFPSLLGHIIPLESPMEVAARLGREEKAREWGVRPEEIGTFFITPCAAKVTSAKQPEGSPVSSVDGVLSMSAVYAEVVRRLPEAPAAVDLQRASGLGIGWGAAGGEGRALGTGTVLAVDGIHNVVAVLEEMERGALADVDFVEAQACVGGCVGGPLAVQNPFVSRVRMRRLVQEYGQRPVGVDEEEVKRRFRQGFFDMVKPITPRPVLRLDEDVTRAIRKMDQLEKTLARLPGLDCGACGSPTCRALAEDIVRERAFETDCIFQLREHLEELAERLVQLTRIVPPALSRERAPGGGNSGDSEGFS